MNSDGDIAAALPEPPPPRPARREAAIEAALQRFDGGGATDRPPAATPASWRGRIVRPQFAALATAALVALIGLPVWMSADHQFSSVSRQAPAGPGAVSSPVPATVNNPASAPVARQVPASPPPKSTATTAPMVSPRLESALPNPPSAVVADRRDTGCAGGTCAAPIDAPIGGWRVEGSDKANVAGFSAPEPRPVDEKRLDKDHFARAENRAELAYAPPPPPPAPVAPPAVAPMAPGAPAIAGQAMADASSAGDIAVTGILMRKSSNADLVVTGQRRSAAKPEPYGDWNACTVDDPRQRLGACRKLVDPAAAGPEGRAAAHVADGLSLAWRDDLDGAIAAFDQAIAISPRLSFAYLNRGLVYAHKGELDRALDDLNRAVRYAPNVARNYYSRSLLWRQRGDAKRAAVDQARAIALDR
jgi:hypothetical protein